MAKTFYAVETPVARGADCATVRNAAAWLRAARCLQRGDQLITIIGRRRGNQQPDTAADQTVLVVSPTLSLILTQASVTINIQI